jgi:activating signal cointegrator complex subunit 3
MVVFVFSNKGSGKTVIAELALLRMKKLHPDGICVYIAPLKSLARERLKEWQKRFGNKSSVHWNILELSGDTHHDQRALQNADVLVCTPEKWDLISRNWRGKPSDQPGRQSSGKSFIKRVRLLVIDEIHLLGEERGAVLEAIVSRTRFISKFIEEEKKRNTESPNHPSNEGGYEAVRIVGLSTAIANPHDLADWIGIDIKGNHPSAKLGLYNFRPSIRPVPTTIHIQGKQLDLNGDLICYLTQC